MHLCHVQAAKLSYSISAVVLKDIHNPGKLGLIGLRILGVSHYDPTNCTVAPAIRLLRELTSCGMLTDANAVQEQPGFEFWSCPALDLLQ